MAFKKSSIIFRILINIFELVAVLMLCRLFFVISERTAFDEDYTTPFCVLFCVILFGEWIRRGQLKTDRPNYEKFIYLLIIFILFLIGVYFMKVFSVD